MIKAVIFDLDDTLISEHEYVKSGYRHIAKIIAERYQLTFYDIYENLLKFYSSGMKNVFNELLSFYNIRYTENDIIFLIKEYRNHLPSISFYSDVLTFIDFLRQHNIKIGIITDGYISSQRKKLEAINAYQFFDEIIITDELGREYWKPNKKAYELMKERLLVDFDEMLYIGDNPQKDFFISSVYPIKAIRISRKDGLYYTNNYLESHMEYLSVRTLDELYKEIISMKILFVCDRSKNSKEAIKIIESYICKENIVLVDGNKDSIFNDENVYYNPDYIISFNSPWDLPKSFIDSSKIDSIGFHCGSLDYPGECGVNFAIYDCADTFGSTAYSLKHPDKIIYTDSYATGPNETVSTLQIKAQSLMLLQLTRLLNTILKSDGLKYCDETWTHKPYTKQMLNDISLIKSDYSRTKIDSIFACLEQTNIKPYVQIGNDKYELSNLRTV